jgi:NIPSNAP
MYVEERMYTLKPGTAPEYLNYYQTHGMKVQLKHLPHMVGYYVDQRERCRAAMSADPDWQAYTAKIRPLMKRQETRIMKCAPFFVDRLKRMLAAVK